MLGAKAGQRTRGKGGVPRVEQVHGRLADERRHESVHRIFIDLLGRSDLSHLAALHDHDAVAQAHCLHLVVRHVHGRGLDLALEPLQIVPGRVAQLGVEVGQRLVQQKDLGVSHEGAAQGDALALPARQLARVAIEVTGDAEHLGGPPHLLLDLLAGRPARLQREGDVLKHGPMGVEGVALEHHGDAAGPGGHVAVDPQISDVDLARRRSLQPCDHAQQGRLARAGGAEQDEKFSVADRQVHPIDRV